jgi:hypothetical protein
MKKVYAATSAQLRVLKYSPKFSHCIPQRDLQALKNLSGTIVFLCLRSGKCYWYAINSLQGDTLTGAALIAGQWRYLPIRRSQVCRFY